MNSNKTKIGSMFLLAAVLVAGTISMTIPSSFASSDSRDHNDYYGKDRYYDYKDDYAKDPYKKHHEKDPKYVSVQNIKCINSNININGVNVNQPPQPTGAAAAELQGEDDATNGNGMFGDGGINIDRNLVNICVNVNLNGQEQGEE